MGVQVKIGSTSDLANTIGKSYTLSESYFTAELKQPCSVEHPVLILSHSIATPANIESYNYCEIKDFGRYYFCTATASPQGIVLDCICDPLESFKTSIKALSCVIARNEHESQSMIIDQSYVTGAQDRVYFKNFSSGYTRGSNTGRRFVLLVT